MQVGDLVRVKDFVGYNAYMQNLMGHIGVVLKYEANPSFVRLHISELGKNLLCCVKDLEVISESR